MYADEHNISQEDMDMALKKAEPKKQTEPTSEDLSRRGRTARSKGGSFERKIAKIIGDRFGIELKRTPQSGGFAKKSELADDFRGDITIVNPKQYLKLHIECKNQKSWSLPQWLRQAEEDCPKNRVPMVIFHQHNTSQDYVCLKLEDFLGMVERDKVVGKREID